jgi:predicted kinase
MTQTLYIYRGLPASGKSTMAQNMVDKSYGSIVRIERDMLRDQLYNGRIYSRPNNWDMTDEEFKVFMREREDTITQVQNSMVSAALKAGKSVIVSDTNLPAKTVKSWIALARKHNVAFEIQEFDIEIEECIKRDQGRENAVGEEVIRRMANAHTTKGKIRKVTETPVQVLEIEPYKNTWSWDMPEAVIVDIDGTLAKMKDRSPYEWMRVGEDDPVQAVIDAVKAAHAYGARIIVMSGRDASCRLITVGWLKQHFGPDMSFKLFMRAEGDNRKDDIVKYELFNQNVRDKYHVKYVLDDRDQVVAMWRKLGLACFQVEYGDF